MSRFALPPALAQRAREGRLAHAYILTGGAPDTLADCARAVAAACLCREETPPCGGCKACRKVEKDIHPDLITVRPEPGKELKVDQIRQLRADAYVRPNEAPRKVYLIAEAERMNASAQNAFLKVLEEGPAYAVFLLLTANDAALLPTIRSRCETVRVATPGSGAMDPEWERKGGELAGLLLGDDMWRLVSWCVPYEKAKREEVLPLWEATRRAILTYRTAKTTPKAARLAQALEEIVVAGTQNGNVGILWGRLLAEAQ